MKKVRTVEIWKHESFDEAVEEIGVSYLELDRAIGYLARWSIHSNNKQRVVISCNHDGNIMAGYYDGDNNCTYEIGAILREDGTYSFHS